MDDNQQSTTSDTVINESLEETNMKPKKKYKLKKKYYKHVLIFLGAFLGVIYLIGALYYNDKFLPNTTINNHSVSGLTLKETSTQLQESMSNHTLTLTFIDGETEVLNQAECGLTYNPENDFEKEYHKQNQWLWFIHFFASNYITVDNILTIDQTKLDNKIAQLNHLQAENQVEPADAKVVYKNNQFSVEKETIGSKINNEAFQKIIMTSFENGDKEVNIKENNGYILPKKKSDDASFQKLLEAANQYAAVSITYQTTTGDLILDGNTIVTWLSIDENGNYYRDDNEFKKQVTSFVENELADKINIVGKRKTFIGANNRQLSVAGGNYGYKLSTDKEIEGLLKDIYDKKSNTRTPITTGIQASYQNGGLGDTFVEIDMTKQHMWLHKNGSIVLQSDIVSGLAGDPNKRTPGGTYYIYFMQLNRTLIGEIQADGKPEYETPVAYWMAFNRGIGLHDATWQPRFGGNLYYTKGSHGCINLPLNIAKQLYSLVKVNTPVVCYY